MSCPEPIHPSPSPLFDVAQLIDYSEQIILKHLHLNISSTFHSIPSSVYFLFLSPPPLSLLLSMFLYAKHSQFTYFI